MNEEKTPPRFLTISRENAAFQVFEALKTNRDKRKEYGKIFVEGVAAIDNLVAAGVRITDILHEQDKPLSSWARNLIAQTSPGQVCALSSSLMRGLSDRENPSEIIALAGLPDYTGRQNGTESGGLHVLADRPISPGNLGTLIRTCDAFGIDGLFLLGHAADPFDPLCIRASIGTVFHLPIASFPSNEAAAEWISRRKEEDSRYQVVVTSAKASLSLAEADFASTGLVVIGNETHGVSRFLSDLSDKRVRIPIRGHASSLNMAAAASIILYEIMQQARFVRKTGPLTLPAES